MKDVDKIKEKSEKDEVKSTIGLVFLFLVVFGIIAFAIIELTSEYLELKRELNKNKITKKDEIALDENSKKYGYTLEGDKINVREIGDKTSDLKESEDAAVSEISEEKKKKEVAKKDIGESQQAIPQPVTPKVITPQVEEEKSKKTQQTLHSTTPTVKKPSESQSQDNEKRTYDAKELYTVQLMALKSEADAKKAVERYKSKIDDIYYIKVDLGEKGVWYRIRCCNTDSLDEAKSKANEIEKNLNLKPLVVRRK